jgi:hypothetical protein
MEECGFHAIAGSEVDTEPSGCRTGGKVPLRAARGKKLWQAPAPSSVHAPCPQRLRSSHTSCWSMVEGIGWCGSRPPSLAVPPRIGGPGRLVPVALERGLAGSVAGVPGKRGPPRRRPGREARSASAPGGRRRLRHGCPGRGRRGPGGPGPPPTRPCGSAHRPGGGGPMKPVGGAWAWAWALRFFTPSGSFAARTSGSPAGRREGDPGGEGGEPPRRPFGGVRAPCPVRRPALSSPGKLLTLKERRYIAWG